MAQIFPERLNNLPLAVGLGAPLGLIGAVAFVWYFFSPWYTQVGYRPVQPVPYSHKQHLAMGLQCKNCHTSPDPGEMMGIPPVKVCMGCHTSVKTDSPHIQKLAKHAADKTEPPWVRIYQIPAYVFFSHKVHLETGAK